MHRELNPQLFGNQTPVEKMGTPVDPSQPARGIMGKSESAGPVPQRHLPYPPIDLKAVEHQISTVKVALIQMDKRTEALAAKMEELARSVHSRLERFSQALVRMEETQSQQHQETTAKFAHVVGKVNERKLVDGKMQELVERHNGIIRNFENRLLALQRLVSEQELALHNSQAALDEARTEIARLKRL